VWAAESGKALAKFELPSLPARLHLTFTADGSSVVTHADSDTVVRSWDALTGERGKDWSIEGDGGVVALARHGNRVLARGRSGASGHPVLDRDKKSAASLVEPWDAGVVGTFAPDGGSIALRTGGRVRLVNATTGKANWEGTLTGPPSGIPVLAFSPEGKYLLLSTGDAPQNQLAVLAAGDGKELCRVPLDGRSAVISADGRVVAAATLAGMLRVFDLWTEREVVDYATPSSTCFAVAASPDGKSLALVGLSSTDRLKMSLYVTAFPVLPLPIHPKTDLSAEEEAEYWTALTAPNLLRRKHAEEVFLARPDQTRSIAARRLAPVPDIERLRAEDLVQNLSDPDPEFRARVAAELDRYAVPFQPLLAAAHDKAAGDARAKIAAALKKAGDAGLPASVVADLRGVEMIERLGTPAARAHLAKVAAGAKGARLTEAAAAALKRLDAKPQ
jgi:hypothetical protein